MKSLKNKYGAWAVVTGASSGIGRSITDRLARAGLNVVLVARSAEALAEAAEQVRTRHAVQARVLALDLADPAAAEALDRETAALDVGLLVNNAAVEQCGAFVRLTGGELRRAIDLNITTPAELGRRFGRRFVLRGRGGIVFVAGMIAHQAVPHLASYAAAKAHQLSLAEALYHELRPHGVDVLAVSPGLTKTPMVGRLQRVIRFGRIGMIKLRPDTVARVALRHLGRRPSVVAGWQYKFFALLTKRILSRRAGSWLFGTLMRFAFADKALLDPAAAAESQGGERGREPRRLGRSA